MPLQYESILAEHQHTRSSAGLFDLSHMGRLTIDGPDAGRLLQHATTNDVERLEIGAAHYSLLCNERGGVIEDLLAYRFADHWRLVVNAANRERVVAHLLALRDQLKGQALLHDDTAQVALLGLQGPNSQEVLQALCQSGLGSLRYYHGREESLNWGQGPVIICRTGYTGEDGFEIMVEAVHAEMLWRLLLGDPRVRPVGLGARDTLRLEAGMALYGHELGEDITPYEAGLGRVVKLEKGPFVGRDALAWLAGQPPARNLAGLVFDPGPVPRQGNLVSRDGQEIGAIASGTFSPTLRRPIASAFVRLEAAEPGTEVAVSIRDSQIPARVVSLPFVPHRTTARTPLNR